MECTIAKAKKGDNTWVIPLNINLKVVQKPWFILQQSESI